jgi:hypothetical protein
LRVVGRQIFILYCENRKEIADILEVPEENLLIDDLNIFNVYNNTYG